ncbi:hypothetical protein GCM10020221_35200 [Streptomyces thioluteus]|uniref:Uncharacterized protein n=1 Tax=Streptomyces thioluteus TaxID=66431 RepID=A0ABP6JKJ9_STRTU
MAPRAGPGEVLGEPHRAARDSQRSRTAPEPAGRLGRPAPGGEDGPDLVGQILGGGQPGVGAVRRPGRAAQQHLGLADLGALEEPLGPAQLVGHAHVGEGLLVALGLGVDAVEDRDLAGGTPEAMRSRTRPGDALGLGGLVGELRVGRLRAALPLGDQLQAVVGGAGPRAWARSPLARRTTWGVER